MMAMTLFSLGVFLSTMVAAVWHGVQSSVETGGKRRMHLAVVVSMIFVLICLGLSAPEPATRIAGAALALSGVTLAALEDGLERGFCAASIAFGLGVILGLPYAIA